MNFGRGAACLAAVCVFVPGAAQAAIWAADPSLELTSGGDSNYGLSFDRPNRVGLASMTGGLVAARETENSATHLTASLVGLLLRGDAHQNEWQDSLALSHTLTGPVDSFGFDAKTTRDETLQTPVSSADVLIGRGLQLDSSGNANWDRHITERLGASAALGVDRHRYSAALAGAHDYQNGSGSASLRYLLDERDSVNASLAHQDYRTLANDVRSFTDSLTVGASRSLTETSSASVSLGAYRSRTGVLQEVLACADAACTEPIIVAQVGHSARWGVQYNASYGGQITELTKFAASAARQQDPSGAGVTVLSDTLRASLEHSWSETLSGSLIATQSTSRYEGIASGQDSRLQTLAAVISKSISPQLTLRANADYRRSTAAFDGLHAHSASVSVTLRYEWQRLEAHH